MFVICLFYIKFICNKLIKYEIKRINNFIMKFLLIYILCLALLSLLHSLKHRSFNTKSTSLNTIKHKSTNNRAFLNNFAETCQEIELEEHYLKAVCRDADGNWGKTQLDLDKEIRNNNGKLEWSDEGGYTKTCDFCYLSQFSIRCQCYNEITKYLDDESGVNFWPVRNYYGELQVKLDYN